VEQIVKIEDEEKLRQIEETLLKEKQDFAA
jgi:hypothetical protein